MGFLDAGGGFLPGVGAPSSTPPPPTETRKYGVLLIGTKDGVNRVFTTPDHFDPATVEVFHNGRRLDGTSPVTAEYALSEGGGVGTGYNTVTLLMWSPVSISVLITDYNTP